MRTRSLRLCFLTVACLAPTATPQSGNPGCETSPCNNPVPCQDLYGTWIADTGASWQLDTDWPMGDTFVTGTVTVPAPQECSFPIVNFSVSGTLTRVWGTSSTPGRLDFTVTASNPDQSSEPGCEITSSSVRNGSIPSNGCDTGSGTWTSALGSSGSFTWERSICKVPDGNPAETTFSGSGWRDDIGFPSAYEFRGQLNASSALGGRQVFEAANGTPTDACWDLDAPFPPFAVSGGWWNVGFWGWNQWGDDAVGRAPSNIDWIRANEKAPCTATAPVKMQILCDTGTDPTYSTHSNEFTVTSTQITATRQGVSRTKTF